MNQTEIGKFIAELRKEQKLTQAELGEKIGVTNKTISRWENGNYMPDVSTMQSLCEVLGITINELISARHLTETNYRQQADQNLLDSLTLTGNIRREIKLINTLNSAGIGLLLGTLYSPASLIKTLTILISILSILTSWLLRKKYDTYLLTQLPPKN